MRIAGVVIETITDEEVGLYIHGELKLRMRTIRVNGLRSYEILAPGGYFLFGSSNLTRAANRAREFIIEGLAHA